MDQKKAKTFGLFRILGVLIGESKVTPELLEERMFAILHRAILFLLM